MNSFVVFYIHYPHRFQIFYAAAKAFNIIISNMDYIEENHNKNTNKKIIYKVQKLLRADTVFYCECGKIYLSFPALYLHCRSKHDVKLTTKMSPQVCSITQQAGYEKITYFLNPKVPLTPSPQSSIKLEEQNIFRNHNSELKTCEGKSQLQQLKKLESKLNSILQHYFSDKQLSDFQKFSLEKLMDYTLSQRSHQLMNQNEEIETQDEINSIPLALNDFIFSSFSEQQRTHRRNDIGTTLLNFCGWLNRNMLTEYQIEYSPTWSF